MDNIYIINNEKFNSIYFSINFTSNANKKEMSENAVLASILSKSCEKYKTEKEIQEYLYSLYGSNFNIGVEKFGDLYNIEFRGECINENYLPEKTDVVNDVLEFMYNIIFKPDLKDGSFNQEIVNREKENIINKIKEIKDDKLRFGIRKMEELMCKDEPFATSVYGDEEEVGEITNKDLVDRYKKLLNDSCVTVVISGNLKGYDDIKDRVSSIFSNKLKSYIEYKEFNYNIKKEHQKEVVEEKLDTTQSILAYGLRLKDITMEDFYVLNVYNAILGGTPSSKLFQNFRERESLAYTVRSRYYRYKDMIIIYAGIEKENYEKAKKVLEKQITDIKLGDISDEEFNASKQSIISDLKEWNDSKIALSKMYISNMFATKTNTVTLDEMIERVNKVTKEDIINIAKKVEIEKIFFLGGELSA